MNYPKTSFQFPVNYRVAGQTTMVRTPESYIPVVANPLPPIPELGYEPGTQFPFVPEVQETGVVTLYFTIKPYAPNLVSEEVEGEMISQDQSSIEGEVAVDDIEFSIVASDGTEINFPPVDGTYLNLLTHSVGVSVEIKDSSILNAGTKLVYNIKEGTEVTRRTAVSDLEILWTPSPKEVVLQELSEAIGYVSLELDMNYNPSGLEDDIKEAFEKQGNSIDSIIGFDTTPSIQNLLGLVGETVDAWYELKTVPRDLLADSPLADKEVSLGQLARIVDLNVTRALVEGVAEYPSEIVVPFGTEVVRLGHKTILDMYGWLGDLRDKCLIVRFRLVQFITGGNISFSAIRQRFEELTEIADNSETMPLSESTTTASTNTVTSTDDSSLDLGDSGENQTSDIDADGDGEITL